MMIYKKGLELIGHTPMFQLPNENIFLKLEKYNLGGSIKDRAALGMIEAAERDGLLNKDSVIIDATSGNTGIGLALVGKLKGYAVTIVMPDTMSVERRNLVKAYGAELILTDGKLGMKGAIDVVNEIASGKPKYFLPNQFSNPANWQKHYETTGVEIIDQVPDVDIFLSGVGTGGSFVGISKRLKEYNSNIICVAAEPVDSPVLSGGKPGPHKIQGMGPGFVTDIFDFKYADRIIQITYEDAEDETINFSKNTGILIGLSSGANISGAKALQKIYGKDKKIVTLAPDGGEKYLSLGIY